MKPLLATALIIVGSASFAMGFVAAVDDAMDKAVAEASVVADRHDYYPSYDVEDSPCGMTWDNGMALDAEDCDYMGGGGWNDEDPE